MSNFGLYKAFDELGIGYANGKSFVQRLNKFGITKEEFIKALEEI
jgi:ribonuclease M5